MTGRFIAIVGPSGVGKDSVMEALAKRDPRFKLARRVITRPKESGGEIFDGVTKAEFTSRKANGDFALDWCAHGLRYAIPNSVDDHLASGLDVLANLSRSVLVQAKQRFDRFEVVLLRADRDVLAQRLHARGRENSQDIMLRLERADYEFAREIMPHLVDNSGELNNTVDAILAKLNQVGISF